MSAKPQRQLTREQRTTVVYGMLCFVLILVVLQLWLLTATMNAYLGGDDARRVARRSARASAASLLNLGLLRYLFRSDDRTPAPPAGRPRRDAPGVLRARDGDRHRLDRLRAARAARRRGRAVRR